MYELYKSADVDWKKHHLATVVGKTKGFVYNDEKVV